MAKSTTFSALFLGSSLPPDTKILRPSISFRVEITDIDIQYELYTTTCAYVSSLLEVVDLTNLNARASGIIYLRIIIIITSAEVLILLSWKFSMPYKILLYPILKKGPI